MADERITVSRDALRADLAELELRLRIFLQEQLAHKADQADMTQLALALDKFAQGEFSEAQLRAIDQRVDSRLNVKSERAWTNRDRVITVLSFITAVSMLAVAVVAALHEVGIL